MINLYRKNEMNFKHNQFVLTECRSCDVTEEINTMYELTLEYPLNDSKDIAKELVNEAFIKVPSYDERAAQLFVIRRAKPNIENNIITCYAQAISIAKLDNNIILDTNIVNKTRKQAIEQILINTFNPHKFVVGNKDINENINSIRIVRYSPITAFIGDKANTIKNTYGGEMIPDNFNVDFVDQRGSDKGITVRYSKNITGAELILEDIEKITEIIPVGSNGLMIPEVSVKASNFDYNNPFTKTIEFTDIGVVDAEYDENGKCTNADKVITQDQAFELLRQACRDKFNAEKINEVSFNLTLNFIELADCIDFEGNDYSEIQNKRVSIGDTINVNIKPLNIDLKGRIYKLTRDSLTGRLKSAEIGYKKPNIITTINKTGAKVEETQKNIDKTKTELKEDIKEANEKTDDLKVTMEAKDASILLEVHNNKTEADTKFEIMDGEIEERVTNEEFSSYRTQTANLIDQKVSRGNDFYTQIEESADAIVETIHGATDNKMTLDSEGLTIERGGFTFIDDHGDNILSAYTGGGARIGDDSWSKSRTMERVYFGSRQMISYFELSNILIDDELNMGSYDIFSDGTIYTVDFEASGSKNCVQGTINHGKRLINAYETAEYYFGDLGFGTIQNGECLIAIDPILFECITTSAGYHVFTQAYSGSITKIERHDNYFVVYGADNTEFSWEIKAKRKGFENNRLELSKNY